VAIIITMSQAPYNFDGFQRVSEQVVAHFQ